MGPCIVPQLVHLCLKLDKHADHLRILLKYKFRDLEVVSQMPSGDSDAASSQITLGTEALYFPCC